MSRQEAIDRLASFDTIVVPARPKGFSEVFLGMNRWQNVKIDKRRMSVLKYIAVYQTAPVSAITHYAEIGDLEPLERTGRFNVYLKEAPIEITHVRYTNADICALQGPRYTKLKRLLRATHLTDAF